MIREMRYEDNAQVRKIIQDSLESLGLAIPGTAYFDPQLGDLYSYYSGFSHADYWVIEREGQIVGGVGIAPYDTEMGICELQKLYLIPKAQGLGLSKQLMNTALDFAAQHYQQCYLETLHDLKTACLLYEKYGFSLLPEPLPGSEHTAMDAWYIKDLS